MDKIIEKTIQFCAIYVRVSQQKKNKEKFSIPAQIRILTEFAKQKEWTIYKIYNENEGRLDASGETITDRPKMQQLLNDAKEHKFQICLVIELERLSRSEDMYDWLTIRKVFLDSSIKVYTPSQDLDLSDEDDTFLFYLFGSLSSREKQRTLKRLKRGTEEAARRGVYLGTRHVKFGYKYDKNTRKLTPIQTEIDLIKLGFNKVSEGMSIWAWVNYITGLGYRNRYNKPFTTRHWSCVFRSRIYYDGFYRWNEIQSEKPIVEPIVSEELWKKANAVIDFNKLKIPNTSNKRSDSHYILQGVLKCSHCERNMSGGSRLSNHKTRAKKRAYRCSTYLSYGKNACKGESIDADTVEQMAYEILTKVVKDKDLLELEKEEIRNNLADKNPKIEKNISLFTEQLSENKKKQRKCMDAYYNSILSPEQFDKENKLLLDEQKHLDEELIKARQLQSESEAYIGNIEKIFQLLENFDEIWHNLSPEDQKRLYRSVFRYIYIRCTTRKGKKSIDKYDLYEPFKSILDWQNYENNRKNQCENSVLQLKPSVVR